MRLFQFFALQFKRIMMCLVQKRKKRPDRTHRWFVVVSTMLRIWIWAPFFFHWMTTKMGDILPTLRRQQSAHDDNRDMIYRFIRMLTCCGDGNSLSVACVCVCALGTIAKRLKQSANWCRWSRRIMQFMQTHCLFCGSRVACSRHLKPPTS